MQDLVGRPAQEPLAQPRRTVRAHDQEIGLKALCFGDQRLSDPAHFPFRVVRSRMNTMVQKVPDHLVPELRLVLVRWVFNNHEHRHFLCVAEVGHALRQGSGRLSTTVPRKQDVIEHMGRRHTLRHHIDVPSRAE